MASEVTPMVPVPDEQDEAIFAAWEDGKGIRALARQFGRSVVQIEQALDRLLPVFDAASQLRAYKRELEKMECLSSEFYTIAKREKNPECAHLVARLNERICAMRGIGPINVRMDPYTVEVAQQPSQFDRIKEAIERICDSQPPAQREAINLISKVGPERALGLLKAATTAMARATAMVLAVTTRPIRANGQAILSPSGPESARHVATYVQVVPILCGLLRWQRISPLVRNQPQLGGHDVRQPALISLNDWPRFQSYPHIGPRAQP